MLCITSKIPRTVCNLVVQDGRRCHWPGVDLVIDFISCTCVPVLYRVLAVEFLNTEQVPVSNHACQGITRPPPTTNPEKKTPPSTGKSFTGLQHISQIQQPASPRSGRTLHSQPQRPTSVTALRSNPTLSTPAPNQRHRAQVEVTTVEPTPTHMLRSSSILNTASSAICPLLPPGVPLPRRL